MKALLTAACLLASGAVACSGAADIPTTPDLRELLESYEHPTASLDRATVDAALDSALQQMPNLQTLAAGLDATKYVANGVKKDASGKAPEATGRVRIQGSVRLNIRCPGEPSDPVYDEAVNGSVSITIAVANSHILRSVGGEAKACVIKGTLAGRPARMQLDGSVAFDFGRNIGIRESWSGDFLASLPGELRVDDYVFQSISARFKDGRFQHLVRLDEGSIVLELSEDGITVRDGSGVWFCSEGQPCAKQ